MDTTLQSSGLTAKDLEESQHIDQEAEEHHIHLPQPSLWPILLSVAITVTVIGLLFIPDAPWLTVIGAPFVLIGILGWGLENPMGETEAAPAVPTGPMDRQVLEKAREVVEQIVTVSSTVFSTHPITVELENDGAALSLYGKVELEAQRQEIEDAVRSIPGVTKVNNFIVAEDAILGLANAKLDSLRAKGKLEGASNLSVLVENYILHLYGDTPTKEMKYMLEREMLGLPGVRIVVNHIGLNKDIPGNLGKTLNKVGGV
jgi:osmotically-inducible protein OsmY